MDSFFNLYGIEFHIFTLEYLKERCRREAENCGKIIFPFSFLNGVIMNGCSGNNIFFE